MIDWVMVGGIGAAATALFTGYALWQRAIERPRPRWGFARSANAFAVSEGDGAWLYVDAINTGDGAALDVELHPVDTQHVERTNDSRWSAHVAPGERVTLAVRTAHDVRWIRDRYNSPIDVPATPEIIGTIRVRVTWRHPPHRWWKRWKTVRVKRIEP